MIANKANLVKDAKVVDEALEDRKNPPEGSVAESITSPPQIEGDKSCGKAAGGQKANGDQLSLLIEDLNKDIDAEKGNERVATCFDD